MNRCLECGSEFEKPRQYNIGFNEFICCPYCGDSDFEEIFKCDECGEWFYGEDIMIHHHHCYDCATKVYTTDLGIEFILSSKEIKQNFFLFWVWELPYSYKDNELKDNLVKVLESNYLVLPLERIKEIEIKAFTLMENIDSWIEFFEKQKERKIEKRSY
jgi:DNA-directed RNA polymerase subunit RPC12/RpoP